jgi:hypothetical protein
LGPDFGLGTSIDPLLARPEPEPLGSSIEPPLTGPLFRVGNIVEPGLGPAKAESPGASPLGAANLVEHFGHFNWRPAAASGTFSTTPQWGQWIVRVMVFRPREAEVG